MSRGVFALVPAMLVCALPMTGLAQDVIIKRDGTTMPLDGGRPLKVLKETVKEVTYQLQDLPARLKLPAKQVRTVKYDRQPDAYRAGQEAFTAGDYESAIGAMDAAMKRAAGYHWLLQYALYRKATALSNLGAHKDASDAFRELLKRVPDTRFLPQAWLGVIRSEFHQGKKNATRFDKAAKDFQRAIEKNKLGRVWVHEIGYWRLLMMQASGEAGVPDAARRLSATAAEENPSVAKRAQILVGLSLLDAGKLGEAQKFFEDILDSAEQDQHGVKASAYAGLGECIFKSGPDKDTSHLPRARELFLRTIVLGDRHPEEVDRAVFGRAMFYAARCFALLKRDKNQNNPTRHARRLFSEVIRLFPGTEIAKKAQEELLKL